VFGFNGCSEVDVRSRFLRIQYGNCDGGGGVFGGVSYVGREVPRRKSAFRLNQASLKSTSEQHFNVRNVRSRPPQCLRTSYYEVNLYGPYEDGMPGRRMRSGLGRRTLNLEIGRPTCLRRLTAQLPDPRHLSFLAANAYEKMAMWVDRMVIFIIIKDISGV
jgi:hypothetical protein